jgi:hypothetical protein
MITLFDVTCSRVLSGCDLPKPNSVTLKKEEGSSFEKPKQTYYPAHSKNPEKYHFNNNHDESLKTFIRP